MNDLSPIGHNGPPDPIDTITAEHENTRMEAENWADGSPVETEAQMKAVDALRAGMRTYRIALEAGQKSATAPLYDVYKAELARWKPTIDDAKRIEDCLVAVVGTFKKRLADEKAAAERKAQQEAWEKTRAAQEAARQADAGDIEAQRAAHAAIAEANAAQDAAAAAKADSVKGLRTVTKYEITNHKALLHWIAANDRDAITAFIDEWARKNHKSRLGHITDGLKVWTEKDAY